MPSFSFLSSIWGVFKAKPAPADTYSSYSSSPISASQASACNNSVPAVASATSQQSLSKKSQPVPSGTSQPAASISALPTLSNAFASRSGVANIPTPDTSIFRPHIFAPFTPTPAPAPELEMTDVAPEINPTPPTTPPHDTKSKIPIRSKAGLRPTITPTPQAKRPLPSHPKRDINAEITIEEDDGTLPEGYSGTWNGMRFYDMKTTPVCVSGIHYLCCGHYIHDGTTLKELLHDQVRPCGLNCMKPNLFNTPFNCLQCCAAIKDAIDVKLSEGEKAKLAQAQKQGANKYVVGFLIEFAAKHVKLSGNITETVQALLDDSVGRKCEAADAPEPVPNMPLDEMVQAIYDKRERDALKKANTFKKSNKRKDAPIPELNPEQQQAQNPRVHYYPESYEEPFPPKRTRLTPPIEFGTASFRTPPANAIGALFRKRDFDLYTASSSSSSSSSSPRARPMKKIRLGGSATSGGNDAPGWKSRHEASSQARARFPVDVGEDEEL
ncbi:hypothetical protein K505DRAFT_356394 [Melanomma pulvis-pyrius CBS 109.77]|uniref:Uncharacterized protein n=1 Tax=Melanomma pulvis-pyrius CBS 109.77 TaxID=1314802 RepID=A0A6A6XTZ2_9PLEO|nr:hypothetical protein K505DRAFT_356394 [Melanomma pulvis-pyrius CBS 109.77]